MTKKNTLKEICEDLLKESLAKCKEINSEAYLSGNGAKAYNDKNLFNKSSILHIDDASE